MGEDGSLIGRDCMTQAPKGEVVLRTAKGEETSAHRARESLCPLGAPVPGRRRRAWLAGGDRRRRREIAERRACDQRSGALRAGDARGSDGLRSAMARPKVLTAAEAARLIPDGAIVTVSSSSALGCPDAMLAAIGARFDAEGHPRNLTTLHPIAAGDMWGVKGIDHHRQARLSRAGAGRLLSLRPVVRRAAANLADDLRRRNPRLQRALRHPVRHASRGGGQAAGRADQGRHGHFRRSRSAKAAR